MSFWTDFESFVKVAISGIESELVTIVTKIKPLIIAGAEELATAALNAVVSEAPKVISGSEKLDSAVSSVITGLAGRGKSVAASVAQAAVQTAYNELSAVLNKGK